MPTRSARSATGRDRAAIGDLRRLEAIAVVLPVLFILALEGLRVALVEGSLADYRFHSLLAAAMVAAVVAFSFVMFHFIRRAQAETAQVVADLQQRQREDHGAHDVLLRISNQEPLADVLAAVGDHARRLLACDEAVVCLNEATTRSVQLDAAPRGASTLRDGACIAPGPEGGCELCAARDIRALRASPEIAASIRTEIQSRGKVLGELWAGRRSPQPFNDRDDAFLATLGDLASIAVTGARMRESERQGAILAERERIARELHDSMAQVLGVTHLRLRTLGSSDEVRGTAATEAELSELADLCQEGYRDVRGAILDLRESSRTDRDLVEGLAAYLDKYSHQCGIATSLEAPESVLALPPRSEIQVIRVVQEALANVRKHSGAESAAVRVTRGGGTVRFAVEDDGRGFDPSGTLLDRDGFGLHSMRERMELIGGSLLIDSAPGRGTRVVAQAPDTPARTPILSDADGSVG